MANGNSATWWSRPLILALVFLLFGCLAGAAWFAAHLPVGVTGMVGYDLSRYFFAASVAVALASLHFRSWREYGLGVFFVGLLLGIGGTAMVLPTGVQPGQRSMFVLFLFGFPLAVTVLFSVGFSLAWRRSDRRAAKAGDDRGPAAAPRRFGMGTLLIVVLAVAFVFSAAKWIDLPPALSILVGSFLGIIGGLQMLMNKVPRAASMGTGALLVPLTVAVSWVAIGASSHPLVALVVRTPADVIFVGAHLAALGAVFGYVGGVLVAGLFLVIDLVGSLRRCGRVAERQV